MSAADKAAGTDELNPELWGPAPTGGAVDQAIAQNRQLTRAAYEHVAALCRHGPRW